MLPCLPSTTFWGGRPAPKPEAHDNKKYITQGTLRQEDPLPTGARWWIFQPCRRLNMVHSLSRHIAELLWQDAQK